MQKQFITNASHELKTPLTSILTSADVLEMEYEQDEWVENIQSQGRKLSRLIQDLVTLSRLNEERPFVEKTEFSLSEAVWEIRGTFSGTGESQWKKLGLQHSGRTFCEGRSEADSADGFRPFGQCTEIRGREWCSHSGCFSETEKSPDLRRQYQQARGKN